MKRSTQLKFLAVDGFEEHLELHRLDSLASHGDLGIYEEARRMMVATPGEIVRPDPLVSGRDLIEMGYRPGPQFREILDAVRDAQLEGTLDSREAGVAFVRERFPAAAPSPANRPDDSGGASPAGGS